MKFTNLKSKQALAIAALLFGVAVMFRFEDGDAFLVDYQDYH